MSAQPFKQTRWSLDDLLPATQGAGFDQILADLEATVSELEASRDQLSPHIPKGEFLRLMALVAKMATLSRRLGFYGGLWFGEDTQNQDALAYGGSRSPADFLNEAGIDMASADFWQGGFDVIAGMIDELETLAM